MAKESVIGIQLPPDSTGKITGAFPVPDPDGNVDSNGNVKIIYLPATVLVDSRGMDIGGEILNALNHIADSLDELKATAKLTQQILGG
jgi:hypothetical protein